MPPTTALPMIDSRATEPAGGQAMKIGVMGSAGEGVRAEHMWLAEQLGEAIARSGCVLITGGCPGLPLASARGAKLAGGTVIGISPGLSLEEHVFKFESPTVHHDVLIFTGSGLMGREVVNIRSSDIVVIIGGSSGTLGELAIAYDEGKLIGALTGIGGISDMAESILAACNKETGARVLYDESPTKLIERLLVLYQEEHFRRPSVFCRVAGHQDADSPAMPHVDQDPICGMWITPETAAAKRTRLGKKKYFCSLHCAAQFDDAPMVRHFSPTPEVQS